MPLYRVEPTYGDDKHGHYIRWDEVEYTRSIPEARLEGVRLVEEEGAAYVTIWEELEEIHPMSSYDEMRKQEQEIWEDQQKG